MSPVFDFSNFGAKKVEIGAKMSLSNANKNTCRGGE